MSNHKDKWEKRREQEEFLEKKELNNNFIAGINFTVLVIIEVILVINGIIDGYGFIISFSIFGGAIGFFWLVKMLKIGNVSEKMKIEAEKEDLSKSEQMEKQEERKIEKKENRMMWIIYFSFFIFIALLVILAIIGIITTETIWIWLLVLLIFYCLLGIKYGFYEGPDNYVYVD